jgi:1-phosphofructokinase
MWKERLRALDIPFYAMPVNGETRINTILTDRKDGTQTRISAPGPCISAAAAQKFIRHLLSVRPKPFFWALGGSLASGMRPSLYAEIVRTLQKEGTPCILDADNEALRLGIEAKPFMIKPNEYEMERLAGRKLNGLKDYKEAAMFFVEKGVSLVVVSLGAKGALFVTAKEAFRATTPPVRARSKVGAGDSLIGGLALGLYKKMDLRRAACLGIAASTSAVMREAPRLCLKKDIVPLLKRIHIRNRV